MKAGRWMLGAWWLLGMCGLAATETHGALVAFWDFNNSGADTTTNPLNMTFTGGSGVGAGVAPTYSQDRPNTNQGTGVIFKGRSLQINSGDSFGYTQPGANTKLQLNTFTIETWIKPSVSNATGVIYSYVPTGAGGVGKGVIFGLGNGKVYMQFSNTTNNSFVQVGGNNATTLQANNWYHIAISFEWPFQGTNTSFAGYKIFVNGAVDGGSGVGYGTPAFTLGIDYANGTGGPTTKTAYISAFHTNNATGSDVAADIVGSLPSGTLLDRLRIHNQIFGSYSNGAQALQLDYFFVYVPEPASALVFLSPLAWVVKRRGRTVRA